MIKNIVFVLSFLAASMAFAASDPATGPGLYIPWPTGWQVGPYRIDKSVMYQSSKMQRNNETVQTLQVTAINVQHGPKPIGSDDLKQLADQLRDQTLTGAVEKSISVNPFKIAEGYYFAATDKHPKGGEFTQLIEGVILNHGYLINFTLLTNDAAGKDATQMIDALDRLLIK